MPIFRDPQRVKRSIEQLMRDQKDDLRLRDHLEGLRKDPAFNGLTWFWGPELYQRNRVVFREIILTHFSSFEDGVFGTHRLSWKSHVDRLEPWLQAARTHQDVMLTRLLLGWKLAQSGWSFNNDKWSAGLLADYIAAQTPATKARILEEYDFWFQLDEPTALALYAESRECSKFVLKHLPSRFTFWGGQERKPWRNLMSTALQAGDDVLAFELYRRQTDAKEWQRDILQLAQSVGDPELLNDELRKRHPEGWGLNLADGLVKLLERRGREVFPYVREKLVSVVGGWYGNSAEPLIKLAEQKQWWDLWAAVVRTASDPSIFNRETKRLTEDVHLDEGIRIERLKSLAGVSQEWNWPGFGFAQVHSLNDEIAAKLYGRYPALVQGPFKPHVMPTWWRDGPKLLEAAEAAGDDDLIDLLASRYVTRAGSGSVLEVVLQDKVMNTATKLAERYQALRDKDELEFARRAGNILTQVPAYSIWNYDQVLRTNSLARLLFVRSFPAFLSSPDAVRDLVEGSEIHVQMLGYRVLAQDDDPARRLAADLLDILQGTLLRPLQRKTRLAAFGALLRAAQADSIAASRVLRRAREALQLPDIKYPKEELVGLIGRILHFRPELQTERERPIIYGLTEASG